MTKQKLREYRSYLSYLVRHKWIVLKICFKNGLFWQGITHDISKFLPTEFFEYSSYFASGKKTDIEGKWLDHLHRNRHHWQYWVLLDNEGNGKPLEMPKKYIIEMVADWLSVALIENGRHQAKTKVKEWYAERRKGIYIHDDSRKFLEEKLEML